MSAEPKTLTEVVMELQNRGAEKTRENSPAMEICLTLGHYIDSGVVSFKHDPDHEGNALHQFIETVDRIFAERLEAAARAKEIAIWEDHARSTCKYCDDDWPAARISDGSYRHFPDDTKSRWSHHCGASEFWEKARVLREQQ